MPTPFRPCLRTAFIVGVLLFTSSLSARTGAGGVSGKVVDPRGDPVAGAHGTLLNSAGAAIRETENDEQGKFILDELEPGEYRLRAEEPGFVSIIADVSVSGREQQVILQFQQLASVSQAITVVASAPSLLTPDPSQSIVIHDQLLDANPGRPVRGSDGLACEWAGGDSRAGRRTGGERIEGQGC